MKRWWVTKIKLEDWISNLAHIALVAVAGTCLIEAVGHSSPIRWRPIDFYNAAVIYAWLTLLCLVSSALRQLAVSAFDESVDEAKRREYYQVQLKKDYLDKDKPVPKEVLEEIQTKSFTFSRISEDGRWQRVLGQMAVLILVGTYLVFVDDDSGSDVDNIAALVFAALVVACMWSGGEAIVVTGRTLSQIARHLNGSPEVKPEDAKVLHEIQIEDIINQISQTFYGPGDSHRYPYTTGHSNGTGIPPSRCGPPGSVHR